MGLLVGGAAAAEFGDRPAVPGLGGELADPGGQGGVPQPVTSTPRRLGSNPVRSHGRRDFADSWVKVAAVLYQDSAVAGHVLRTVNRPFIWPSCAIRRPAQLVSHT
jgi:hypothetical protein